MEDKRMIQYKGHVFELTNYMNNIRLSIDDGIDDSMELGFTGSGGVIAKYRGEDAIHIASEGYYEFDALTTAMDLLIDDFDRRKKQAGNRKRFVQYIEGMSKITNRGE